MKQRHFKAELITVQVPVGVYPEGVIKYRCASRGYTAWWQRKLYFTFLTAYILVIPALFMTFCYVKVVIVVWKRSKELSARTSSNTPTIRSPRDDQSEDARICETENRHREEVNFTARSPSDIGRRRFGRFRRMTTGSERATNMSRQLHSPEADELSAETGNRSSKPPSRFSFTTESRPFRRAATVSECTTYTSSQLRSPEADEVSAGTGNRSNRSSAASPQLRRATFNVAAMSRARVRTVQMTLCIVLSFIACWAPYFTVHLIHIWSEYQRKIPETVYVFAETLALVNSAVNPLLYACFNSSMSCWRCQRRPAADRPLECVDLHAGRSQANVFVSASVDDRGSTWRRAATGSSTWLGHSVDGRRLASTGGNFLGVTGSNGRGTSSAALRGRCCDM